MTVILTMIRLKNPVRISHQSFLKSCSYDNWLYARL